MEKQQEILFSIVSESRNNAQRNSYSNQTMHTNPVLSQIDPYLRMGVDQKLGNSNPSAFRPSRPTSTSNQEVKVQVTPMSNQSQNPSKGFQGAGQTDNNMSHAQLLSEICSSIINKQM